MAQQPGSSYGAPGGISYAPPTGTAGYVPPAAPYGYLTQNPPLLTLAPVQPTAMPTTIPTPFGVRGTPSAGLPGSQPNYTAIVNAPAAQQAAAAQAAQAGAPGSSIDWNAVAGVGLPAGLMVANQAFNPNSLTNAALGQLFPGYTPVSLPNVPSLINTAQEGLGLGPYALPQSANSIGLGNTLNAVPAADASAVAGGATGAESATPSILDTGADSISALSDASGGAGAGASGLGTALQGAGLLAGLGSTAYSVASGDPVGAALGGAGLVAGGLTPAALAAGSAIGGATAGGAGLGTALGAGSAAAGGGLAGGLGAASAVIAPFAALAIPALVSGANTVEKEQRRMLDQIKYSTRIQQAYPEMAKQFQAAIEASDPASFAALSTDQLLARTKQLSDAFQQSGAFLSPYISQKGSSFPSSVPRVDTTQAEGLMQGVQDKVIPGLAAAQDELARRGVPLDQYFQAGGATDILGLAGGAKGLDQVDPAMLAGIGPGNMAAALAALRAGQPLTGLTPAAGAADFRKAALTQALQDGTLTQGLSGAGGATIGGQTYAQAAPYLLNAQERGLLDQIVAQERLAGSYGGSEFSPAAAAPSSYDALARLLAHQGIVLPVQQTPTFADYGSGER